MIYPKNINWNIFHNNKSRGVIPGFCCSGLHVVVIYPLTEIAAPNKSRDVRVDSFNHIRQIHILDSIHGFLDTVLLRNRVETIHGVCAVSCAAHDGLLKAITVHFSHSQRRTFAGIALIQKLLSECQLANETRRYTAKMDNLVRANLRQTTDTVNTNFVAIHGSDSFHAV